MLHRRVDSTDARPSTYRPYGLEQQRKYHERIVRALLASAHRVGACLVMRTVAGLGDQLGLDDEANSEITDASRGNALRLIPETVCSARTPPSQLHTDKI